MRIGKKKLALNSPIVIGFCAICVIVLILDAITKQHSTTLLFSVYRSPLSSPLTYFRFFGHVFGHADLEHLLNNMMYILILGPLLEEKYGKRGITFLILSTALVTGLVHFIFFPHAMLLGASGVVFAMILLASFTGFKEDEIPLTFILVALIYIGQQVYQAIAYEDSVSQLTHILGGFVGAATGFVWNRRVNRS